MGASRIPSPHAVVASVSPATAQARRIATLGRVTPAALEGEVVATSLQSCLETGLLPIMPIPYCQMVVDDPPQPRVVLSHHTGHGAHRHLTGQRQHHLFEGQGEPLAPSRPGQLRLPDPARHTIDARRRPLQERPVPEEIQVPPLLQPGVVGLAAAGAAGAAGERSSRHEVQVDEHQPFDRVGRDPVHIPRPLDIQDLLEEFVLVFHRSCGLGLWGLGNRPRPANRTGAIPGASRRGCERVGRC